MTQVTLPIRIQTERLALRSVAPSDINALVELFSHEPVYRYLCDGEAPSRAVVQQWCDLSTRLHRRGDLGLLVVQLRGAKDGELLGLVGLMEFYEPPVLQLIVAARPEMQGRGYAHEMSIAALNWLAQTDRHRRVRASTDLPNAASRTLLARLRFEEIDRSRPPGATQVQVHFERRLDAVDASTPSDVVQIERYVGEVTSELMGLLVEADPNVDLIESYLPDSELLVARAGNASGFESSRIIGVAALTLHAPSAELKNLVVAADHRRRGLGEALTRRSMEHAEARGATTIAVKTGNSSLGPLALYQRCGFRIEDVVTGHFENYPDPIFENGIRCRDQILLRAELLSPEARPAPAIKEEQHTVHPATPDLEIAAYQSGFCDQVIDLAIRAWTPVFDRTRAEVPRFVFDAFWPDGWETRQATEIRSLLESEEHRVWVSLDRDEITGFVGIRLHPEDQMGEISILAVAPEHQRRGVGDRLMALAERHIHDAGLRMAMVETVGDTGHAPARRKYEARGYERWPVARYFKRLR